MNEIVRIGANEIDVKEYRGQRVVTFKDIDTVHERPDGTAKRNFNANQLYFVQGEDYLILKPSDFEKYEIRTLEIPNRGLTVLTEQGYLMLVKSFTDDLAWKVQRDLVNNYFKRKTERNTYEAVLFSVKFIADDLRMNDASRLLMYENGLKDCGIPTGFLPAYEHNGGHQLKAATALLKENGCDLTAQKFNALLLDHGYLEERQRESSKGGFKKFKALTEKGTEYGENVVSPHNQREVQPLYYTDKFKELYNIVTSICI